MGALYLWDALSQRGKSKPTTALEAGAGSSRWGAWHMESRLASSTKEQTNSTPGATLRAGADGETLLEYRGIGEGTGQGER